MKKIDLQARIDRLKARPAMHDMPAFFGKSYDADREMDLRTSPPAPDETMEEREAHFIEKNGTREDAIKKAIKQWNRQHKKGEANHDRL